MSVTGHQTTKLTVQRNCLMKITWSKFGVGAIITAVVAFFGFLLWLALFVTHVDNHELGYIFRRTSGEIQVLEKKGWVIRTPWVDAVHTIDLRPYQVKIDANERVLTAKLVQFNPEGLTTFIKWHGRSEGDNRERLVEILRSYAFKPNGGADCPFLTVVEEL